MGRGIMAANNVGRSMLAIIVSIVTAGVIGTSFAATPAWAAPRGAGDPARPVAATVKPGNSIGTVGAPLQGNTIYRGKVATTSTDAWYHLYKAGRGTASIHFADTSGGAAPCPDIAISLDNADGTNGNVNFATLSANGSTSFLVTAPGQYYIEITSWACSTGNAGSSYSIKPKGTSAWTKGPVLPAPGTTKAGISIGRPSAPLLGHTLYPGRVANTSTDAWYQLYKTGNGTATIRFEDTTVSGSATCPDIGVSVDNADGSNGNVNFTSLGGNAAATINLTAPGQYFIEITSWACSTGNAGSTYSIEPEPSSRFSAGPVPPTPGTTKPAASKSRVGAPLQGHELYRGKIPINTTQAWYQLNKASGGGTATIRFEDTTISGLAVACPDIAITLYKGSQNVNFTTLGDNAAATLNVTTAGHYYIQITSWACGSGNAGATYSVEPEPASGWTAAR